MFLMTSLAGYWCESFVTVDSSSCDSVSNAYKIATYETRSACCKNYIETETIPAKQGTWCSEFIENVFVSISSKDLRVFSYQGYDFQRKRNVWLYIHCRNYKKITSNFTQIIQIDEINTPLINIILLILSS